MVSFGGGVVRLGVVLRMLPALGLALLFTLGVINETAAFPDPRTDPRGYEAWCKNQGGTIYSYQGSIACRPGSGRPPGTVPRKAPRRKTAPPPDDGAAHRQQREVEARHQREREEEQRAAREAEANAKREERQSKALKKAKEDALGLLKGAGHGTGGLKMPDGDLVPKTGTPVLGLKVSGPRTVTKESRFSKGTKFSAPVVTDPAKVQRGTKKELNSANRKTELLLDALQAARGSWAKALEYLRNWVNANPKDVEARQALAYLQGFHKGYLGAKNIADAYYKYGVRQWIDGDYYGAAQSFAEVVSNNPLDTQAVGTYGYTLGLAMEGRACQWRPKSCPYVDLPARVSGGLYPRREKLAELERRIKQNPADTETRVALEYVKGLLVYTEPGVADLAFKGKPPDTVEGRLMEQGLDRLMARNYSGAVEAFSKAYVHDVRNRGGTNAHGILFAQRYAAGRLAARERRADVLPTNDDRVREVEDKIFQRVFRKALAEMEDEDASQSLERCAQGLRDTEHRNPFFGRLAKSKVAQLVRKVLGR